MIVSVSETVSGYECSLLRSEMFIEPASTKSIRAPLGAKCFYSTNLKTYFSSNGISNFLSHAKYSSLMSFLVSNVTNDRVQLRMAVREGAIPFLPIEPSANPFLLVYEVGGVGLNIPD
jgi:hypothetical protein